MTGIEARDYILEQIVEHDPSGKHTTIKLSLPLASDLTKLTHQDVGSLAEKLLREGVKAFNGQTLFGYQVDIDRNQDDHVVEFSV